MNIYRVTEDREGRLFAAPNYAAAIEAAWADMHANDVEPFTPREEWETSILESVECLGELTNPTLVGTLEEKAALFSAVDDRTGGA